MPAKQRETYDGPVPPETCDYLCRRVIAYARSGRLFPLSPIDVYGDLWLAVESAARRMPTSLRATPAAYLRAVVDNQLKRYFSRRVAPARSEYRGVESMLLDAETRGNGRIVTCLQLSEEIQGEPGAAERHAKAAAELDRLMPLLPDVVALAFVCYVQADGNMLEAARLAHIGKTRFYASWRGWLAVARRIAEKTAAARH